jgi:hypothetical protein
LGGTSFSRTQLFDVPKSSAEYTEVYDILEGKSMRSRKSLGFLERYVLLGSSLPSWVTMLAGADG